MQQYLSTFFTPNLPRLRCVAAGLIVNFCRADPGRAQHEEVLGSAWAGVCGPCCLRGASGGSGGEAVAPEARSPAQVGLQVSPSCSDDSGSLVEPLWSLGFVLWKQKPLLSQV